MCGRMTHSNRAIHSRSQDHPITDIQITGSQIFRSQDHRITGSQDHRITDIQIIRYLDYRIFVLCLFYGCRIYAFLFEDVGYMYYVICISFCRYRIYVLCYMYLFIRCCVICICLLGIGYLCCVICINLIVLR